MPVRRSALYVPASHERALAKAESLAVDVLILDLEDAVAPEAKAAARERAAEVLAQRCFRAREICIRCNALDTPWATEDIARIATSRADAILVPKLRGSAELDAVAAQLGRAQARTRIWAMLETPAALLAAPEIAAHPATELLVLGTNDLLAELQARPAPDRATLLPYLAQALLAARAAGKGILDGVFGDVRDPAGFEREARQGHALGFDGKTLIHPAQIEITHAVWTPSAADVERAHALIAAYRAARAEGRAVAVHEGRMIEELHVRSAERMLALAAACEPSDGRE